MWSGTWHACCVSNDSLAIGGGSLVTQEGGRTSVGPTSVGYRITDEALVFGGQTLTSTDIAVAAGLAKNVGDASKVSHISDDLVKAALDRIKADIEYRVDMIKTNSQVSGYPAFA